MPGLSIIYRPSEILQTPNLIQNKIFDYTPGTNSAIHHSQLLPNLSGTSPTPNVQWYMSGMIGYAGQYGLSPGQVIQSLRRSVGADGTKPVGTIYFENNGNLRSFARADYWPPVEDYMTAHGIPWIQHGNGGSSNSVPINCPDVLGAEIGVAGYLAPSGSLYLPGAWADCLTSWGGIYTVDSQTNMSMLLQAGCAASSGTVREPQADQMRFPLCDIWVFQHDGSTLGEAFYKSVYYPDLIMFQGDLLSQAFADIPQVTFTSAPANHSTISGNLVISASASLNNPLTATGIASLSLFLDGTNTGMTGTGSSATFNFDTTKLTDGLHEMRVIAYNNSAAASEGTALLNLSVNNQGQSVSIGGTSNYNISWNQTVNLPVSAVQGSGPSITGIQLQCNGRVLGSISGANGNIQLSGTQLAYDSNSITPVAILAGSGQIQGTPITVIRQLRPFPGTTVTPSGKQNAGFNYYYYPGVAGNTLATTNFSGTAAYVGHANVANVWPTDLLNPNIPSIYQNGNNAGLAIVIKGSFTITTPGEYGFAGCYGSWTSGGMMIDGVMINSFDLWNGTAFTTQAETQPYSWDTQGTVYLLPGEHTVTIQLVQKTASTTNSFSLWYRGLQPQVPKGTPIGAAYGPAAPTTQSNLAFGPMFYTGMK